MRVIICAVCCFLIAAVTLPAAAFNPPEDKAGPLTLKLEGPSKVAATDAPVAVQATLENSGDAPLQGVLRFEVIDLWKIEPAEPVSFSLEPKASRQVSVSVSAGKGTYNAIYPVHAFADFNQDAGKLTAHAVLLIKTELPEAPSVPARALGVPFKLGGNRTLSLVRVPVYQFVYQLNGEQPVALEPGWQGCEPRTGTSLLMGGVRAGYAEGISIHPPWRDGRFGTAWVEFPVELPEKQPIHLKFATSIRDTSPPEPPSDGVTFRVRVVDNARPVGEMGPVLFERNSDSKAWQEADVDLSAHAGRTVRLQFESNPGPKNDTTCDQSFWGGPTIVSGTGRADAPANAASPYAKEIVLGAIRNAGGEYKMQVHLGPRGLLDAFYLFQGQAGEIRFNGFHVRVKGDLVHDADSVTEFLGAVEEQTQNDTFIRMRHRFQSFWGAFDVMAEVAVEHEAAFQARFWLENTPKPEPWNVVYLEDVSTGPWNETAARVYAGVGNVMCDPKAFTLAFDGHQLSTSFVGYDFPSASIVQAVDVPPSKFEVAPDRRVYTLHAPLAQTLRFVPAASVWDGVKTWRALDTRKAAGGVEKLAGRFVFDLWGGGYEASAKQLEQAFQYGLTDSVVVWHNWQRWGYDYRLPDIYPPNPDCGTLEEFQKLAQLCKDRGVLFAPHDNYIDFYPDADGFSYNRIAFQPTVQPIMAWLNEGRGAQAYRWRTDALRPFLERNLKLIKDNIAPTAFFIDVWSSIGPYESWTCDGQLQDRVYARNAWGEAFVWIRDYLGDNAPQISESGHDQLVGYLDGAQCNHLRAAQPVKGNDWLTWNIDCKDWERIPWVDAAHHDRFALHGAGYESRFLGGLDARAHGWASDDYLSVQVLTGHPAMVPHAVSADVVRVYYLMQDIMRALALQRIENVEFVEGNIHRQHVTWSNGETWVNRGESDWTVQGRRLPQYGFFARAGGVEAAIEWRDSLIVESSQSASQLYAGTRPMADGRLPISVSMEKMQFTPDRQLSFALRWEMERPLDEGYTAFVHFVDAEGKILFQADHPMPQSNASDAVVMSSAATTIPPAIKSTDVVEMRVGVYKPDSPRRPLRGLLDNDTRVRLAKITFKGEGSTITDALPIPVLEPNDPYQFRRNKEEKMVRFDDLLTNGACRITRDGDALVITPVPADRASQIQFNIAGMPLGAPVPANAHALNANGVVEKTVTLTKDDKTLTLTCEPGTFAYRLAP